MNRMIAISVVLLGIGVMGGSVASAGKDESVSLPTVAEKIQKGEIDVGGKEKTAYGMAENQRFHRIHANVLGLECATCHGEQINPSVAAFTAPPAVDVSPKNPGLVDRQVCVGCHVAGPGRNFYGPAAP